MDVSNLFNLKQLSYAGFAGSRDYDNYMKSLHFDWEDGSQNGDDRIGEYRDWDVDYIPMRETQDIETVTSPEDRVLYYNQADGNYMMHNNGEWEVKSKSWVEEEVLDKKAYIDMPNIRAFTFLNPRSIEFGIKITF